MAERAITTLNTENEVVAAMVLAHNAVVANYAGPDEESLEQYIAMFDKAYRAIAKARTDVRRGRTSN
jgi:hypothetical protein